MSDQWVTKLSFQHLKLDFLNEKGEIRIKEEKSRLPVDVRGSKTSMLKLPNNKLFKKSNYLTICSNCKKPNWHPLSCICPVIDWHNAKVVADPFSYFHVDPQLLWPCDDEFMINNRTDTWKTDAHLLNRHHSWINTIC